MNKTMLVLFAHGARDPRWAAPFQRLQGILQARLPAVTVSLAFLEFMTPALPALVEEAVAGGCLQISLVPVFLGQGGHVLRDLPVLIEGLQAAHPGLEINVAQAVGENADVLNAMADYCVTQLLLQA
jgi:sirohydrochlorin cobaltochelatase